MITPKQITNSHTGHDHQAKRKTRAGKPAKRIHKPPRSPQPTSGRDPLFDALRAELGL